ncbi:glycoside hydrolase domain-containing protein [Acidipropionibacterium jensenii]|uniref:glycoside hydrolase domain-containing protein n=1 Tax=Acidipropionibacterium jensenii TaxID=1749 RepID=UPI00214CAB89
MQKTQAWLNATYGQVDGWVPLTENGLTGWATIYGLRRGLQHELGISPVSSGFGSATTAAFISQIGAIGTATTSENLLRLVSGSLWCKGLAGTTFGTPITFASIAGSVSTARTQLGLSSPPVIVDVKMMASLMSMDAYTTLSGQGGTDGVREVEQWLNATYSTRQNFALVPCDGVFSRQIQTAVLYGLQYEFGMNDATANGNFGPGTQAGLKSQAPVATGSSDSTHHFVHLFQGLLRFNGYGSTPFTGSFDAATAAQVSTFQSFMALASNGKGDYGTWCALLVSSGDPNRPVSGFDTAKQLTPAQASAAVSAGYSHVGRYLVGSGKFITAGELAGLKAAGLVLFPIEERYNNSDAVMTADQGKAQAIEALERCRVLDLPAGATVFFAVDYDPTGDGILGPVSTFFTAINTWMNSHLLGTYAVGVYGTRNVCLSMMSAGKASAAFVAGMSTGWSGNMGWSMPNPWAYNQILETTATWAGSSVGVDHDAVAAGAPAVALSGVTPPPTEKDGATTATGFDTVYQWTVSAEATCERKLHDTIVKSEASALPSFILGWLRKPEYWDSSPTNAAMWMVYTAEDTDAASIAARSACQSALGTPGSTAALPPVDTDYRDTPHMAATALGYTAQGLPTSQSGWSFGDFGGWALDLLQIWGQYQHFFLSSGLSTWLHKVLGKIGGVAPVLNGDGTLANPDAYLPDPASTFSYSDVLADADGYELAAALTTNTSGLGLSTSMRSLYQQDGNARITRFYAKRFNSSASNLSSAFVGLTTGSFGTFYVTKKILLSAAHAASMPTAAQADVCARAYAAFLASPHR